MSDPLRIQFDAGTLILSSAPDALLQSLPGCRFDERTATFRTEARHYRTIVESLRQQQIAVNDEARDYQPLKLAPGESPGAKWTRKPFPHQQEALATWWNQSGRGVVVLPTGTGKTFVALLAIAHVGRPTLVITPTIPLMNQWYGEMLSAFGAPIGLLGGGYYDFHPLTVTTYDSAYIHQI